MRVRVQAWFYQVLIFAMVLFPLVARAQSGGATEQILLYFGESAPDAGVSPVAGLTFDQSGNLYGSTIGGGGVS
jgi:hypothetical protein